ncbi:MAG TPA: GDSL-type esterase/lipase family protein [Gallionellaceae bacterium]|nr:GDSL-type esterase/lipase family protein [Gallionellaceae bacterium]
MAGRRNISGTVLGACLSLLAGLPFSAAASMQVVNVPTGSFPGELQCPDQRPAPAKPKGRPEDAFMPPGNEELARLPIRSEAYPQEIYLGERKRADPSRPFSIGLWGDSHAASDYFSEELMRALGLTRDAVQPTFIPPTMDRSGVRLPIHKYCQSPGWSYEYAYTASTSSADFAKGLVNLKSSERNSYLWVDFRWQPRIPALRSVDVLYVPPARGAMILVGISADDGAEKFVELNADGNGVLRIRAERPISTLKLRLILGTLVLQGYVPQYINSPTLYLDTLGIPGATVRGWKALNTDYLKKSDGTPYDLVILEYGTNEGNDQNLDLEKYGADLRASLKNLRQVYPDSLCVLIGPTDRGVLVPRASRQEAQYGAAPSKSLLHYAQVHHRLGAIQEAISKEYSCAYWSWQEAMGGPGGAYSWLRHSPALIARDLTHLTVSGYQLSARKFVADTRLTDYVRQQ